MEMEVKPAPESSSYLTAARVALYSLEWYLGTPNAMGSMLGYPKC